MNLFKNEKPEKAERVCRIENLDPDKEIVSAMYVSADKKKYTVCLCMPGKTVKNTYKNELDAKTQMIFNRSLYKKLKKDNK